MNTPLLSIIVPVYNEAHTIKGIVEKVDSVRVDKEIIIVDDGSTDGTSQILDSLRNENIRILRHEKNKGKGAAVNTGIASACGVFIVPQDADYEYDPADLRLLLDHALKNSLPVVYGSRFTGKNSFGFTLHYFGNRFLTWMTNLLFNAGLTDMETCYKLVKSDLIKQLGLKSPGFAIEPEITAKILKKGVKISEIPVSYRPRRYKEGKKITWKDGISAICCLASLRFGRG